METLKKHLEQKPAGDLYHYTSISGFMGILESQQFWATDIYYMNDTKELVYSAELVEEVLEAQYKDHEHYTVISQIFRGGTYNSQYANIHCISFCEERDHLGQWRGYGGNAGMALCFKPQNIDHIVIQNNMRLAKCIYDRDVQVKIISEICHQHAETISTDIKEQDRLNTRGLAEAFFRDLCQIGPILKHPAFTDENEWRMMSQVYDIVYRGDLPLDRMGFRPGKTTIIPYMKVHLRVNYGETPRHERRIDLGFHDILIGPSGVAELPWRALQSFLLAKNIRFQQITPSGIPLRSKV